MKILKIRFCNGALEFDGDCVCPEKCSGAVVALGNFDGVHLGHVEVLRSLLSVMRFSEKPSAVLVFHPHPVSFLYPHKNFLSIYSFDQKIELLQDLGVDFLFILQFDNAVSQLSSEEFFVDVLKNGLKVSHIVTGYNFHFGSKRLGDVEVLKRLSEKHNIGYSCIQKIQKCFFDVSSTKIKKMLKYGCVATASYLLGRTYSVDGVVVHGSEVARTVLGVHTANIMLFPEEYRYPASGVYLVDVECEGCGVMHGIANIGVRPTVQGSAVAVTYDRCTHQKRLSHSNCHCSCDIEEQCSCDARSGHNAEIEFGVVQQGMYLLEVHLFDYFGNLYGKKLSVGFRQFIRPERCFVSMEKLRAQIESDIEQAHYIMSIVDTVCLSGL